MPRLLLHIDGAAGISGDMTLGALVDLGVRVEALADGLRGLGLAGWSLAAEHVVQGGLRATRVRVQLDAEPPSREHDHAHPHEHGDHGDHDHVHPPGDDHAHGRTWPEIRGIIAGSSLPVRPREAALEVFRRLCQVEADLHGLPLHEVHLHEAGSLDALIDICGACLGLDLLGWPEISASAPDLGGGTVRCAHGILPVPAPATLRLLEGRPVRSSGLPVELTTPTGAALLSTLATRWGAMPAMKISRTGLGAGTKTLPDRANVVRFTLGEAASAGAAARTHVVIEADLDDADPQLLAAFCDRARELGARDATLAAIVMKKGRSGTRLTLLTDEPGRERLLDALFRETTTIGCRVHRVEREECEREERSVTTAHGSVRVKLARWKGRVVNAKPEHEDCLAAARRLGIPLKDVVAAATAAARPFLEPAP